MKLQLVNRQAEELSFELLSEEVVCMSSHFVWMKTQHEKETI